MSCATSLSLSPDINDRTQAAHDTVKPPLRSREWGLRRRRQRVAPRCWLALAQVLVYLVDRETRERRRQDRVLHHDAKGVWVVLGGVIVHVG